IEYSPNGNLLLCGRGDGTITLSPNTHGALGRPPMIFTSCIVDGSGVVRIGAKVQPWTHYLFQSSSNLVDWNFLTAGASASNTLIFADHSISNAPAAFYRAATPP